MIKLLLGGSPCTFWSIAQKNNRETTPTGLGWELFKNYLIAKQKFQPNYFLYENNVSAAEPIKQKIREELEVNDGTFFTLGNKNEYIEINSALVSAQNRQRFYVHNCGEVEQPEDRGILLRDILETTAFITNGGHATTGIAEPIRIGALPRPNGELSTSAGMRIYSAVGKGRCLIANGGGQGAKTGLYAIPTDKPVYEVKDGFVTIKGKQYPIKLADGYYIIRKLTVKECCRLQTMPDDYCRVVSDSQAYKGLGNGWTAEVIIHILSNALKNVPKDERIIILSMYDGIGTGRYCLGKMGFTNIVYHAYEIDKYAMKIALSNYPDIIQHGDAFQVRNNFIKF